MGKSEDYWLEIDEIDIDLMKFMGNGNNKKTPTWASEIDKFLIYFADIHGFGFKKKIS